MGFRISLFCCLFLFLGRNQCDAQHLLPNFNPSEYSELLKLAERMGDTPWTKVKSLPPRDMELVYRGAEVGLVNRWDLWKRKDNVGIIVIRGTNGTATSWLENFYAGMIPAQGTVTLNDSTSVPYKVSADPKAYVHAGWMLAVAAMGPEIIRKINEYYQQGIHEYIIFGHSQGERSLSCYALILSMRRGYPRTSFLKPMPVRRLNRAICFMRTTMISLPAGAGDYGW